MKGYSKESGKKMKVECEGVTEESPKARVHSWLRDP